MPRDAVSRTAHVGTVGKNGLISYEDDKYLFGDNTTQNIKPVQRLGFKIRTDERATIISTRYDIKPTSEHNLI